MSLGLPPAEFFVGVDWAAEVHAVCVINIEGKVLSQFTDKVRAALENPGVAVPPGKRREHASPRAASRQSVGSGNSVSFRRRPRGDPILLNRRVQARQEATQHESAMSRQRKRI